MCVSVCVSVCVFVCVCVRVCVCVCVCVCVWKSVKMCVTLDQKSIEVIDVQMKRHPQKDYAVSSILL